MGQSDSVASALIIAQASLGFLFVSAAIGKFRAWGQFTSGVRDYQILPRFSVRPASVALPIIECALGLGLLLALAPAVTGALTATLLTAFVAAVGINLRRGRRIGCNCYGIAATKQIGVAAIVRIVTLWVIAVTVAIVGAIAIPPSQWFHPSWLRLSSPVDVVLVLVLTSGCLVLIYLLEWAVEVQHQARLATASLGEALAR